MNKPNEDLYDEVAQKALLLTKEELTDFCQDMICFGTSVLRGLEGDEFITGYLKAAIKSNVVFEPKLKGSNEPS